MQIAVLADWSPAIRKREGAGQNKLQYVPFSRLSPQTKFWDGGVLHIGVMSDWTPANRKSEGAGLKQLQSVPIGRVSPQTKFQDDWMLRSGVMADWSSANRKKEGGGAKAITVCAYWPSESTHQISRRLDAAFWSYGWLQLSQ